MRQRRSSRFPGIRRWGFRDRLGRGHVLDDTHKEQFSFSNMSPSPNSVSAHAMQTGRPWLLWIGKHRCACRGPGHRW